MKTFLTMILLAFALSGVCQREYTHENHGVNLFLELDGSANLDFAVYGPSLTIGYQFNPHVFFGAGITQRFGGERNCRKTETRPLGWYDASDGTYHADYYIDAKGVRHRIVDAPPVYTYEAECCDDCRYESIFLDVFMDFRYNFLVHSRYTPCVSLKTGAFFGEYGASDFNDVLLGCRFACGEGDFAIVGGTGWTYYRLHRREGNLDKNQHLFTVRIGVEF